MPYQSEQFERPSPLVFGAGGDAYAFCFEFADAQFCEANNNLAYVKHPTQSQRPGVYSDDTQMHLALAEIIASEREWTALEIANSLVSVYKRDPRTGYASRFQTLLDSVDSGQELIARIHPSSERNGAAVRSPEIGLFPKIDDVFGRCEIQARITHNTKIGVDSSVATALIAHFFAYDLDRKENLPAFLNHHVPGYDWGTAHSGPVAVHGIQTVRAALTAILRSDSLAQILRDCVAFTGDVDSVACIALAAAASHRRFASDLPASLFEGLEQGRYGLNYLLDVDRRVREVTKRVAVG